MIVMMRSRHLEERSSHAEIPHEGTIKYTVPRTSRLSLPLAPALACPLAPRYNILGV